MLKKESREINKRFFTFHEKKRPYIILKWAQTIDGYIDFKRTPETLVKPNWITDEISRTLVHKWRSEEQSILVGTNTVIKDNPKLNVRDWTGNNPLRLYVDKNLKITNRFLTQSNPPETICFNESVNEIINSNLRLIKINFKNNFFTSLFNYLYELKIQSLIVEGGSKLINSFIQANFWDEARIFIGTKFFNEGIKAPKFELLDYEKINFNNNSIILTENNNLL